MTYGEIFSGAIACCAILWGGIRAWNRRRAVLRFFLTVVNVVLLLMGSFSGDVFVVVTFYVVLMISALVVLTQEWHCRKNNM